MHVHHDINRIEDTVFCYYAHNSVMDLWTRLWGRYHVPQNVFLVPLKIIKNNTGDVNFWASLYLFILFILCILQLTYAEMSEMWTEQWAVSWSNGVNNSRLSYQSTLSYYADRPIVTRMFQASCHRIDTDCSRHENEQHTILAARTTCLHLHYLAGVMYSSPIICASVCLPTCQRDNSKLEVLTFVTFGK